MQKFEKEVLMSDIGLLIAIDAFSSTRIFFHYISKMKVFSTNYFEIVISDKSRCISINASYSLD